MTVGQIIRIIWARKWLALALFLIVAIAGSVYTLMLPKVYVASASLVVDGRPDPLLGALSAPANMATQLEILRSDKVATRVVKLLGVERSPSAVQQWRDATKAKIPLDRYFADLLGRGLSIEPGRGSDVINLNFTAEDPAFAASAANAFIQAAIQISVELQIDPARQSTPLIDAQVTAARTALEEAQTKLSQFQQSKGIVVSDERIDEEGAKLNALAAQLTDAQAERVETASRERNSGTETSPDVQQSGAVQTLKSQIAATELKLGEISGIVGVNHPQRVQLQQQLAAIKGQLAAEVRRVSGGAAAVSRASSQKVGELRAMFEEQKKYVLSLRSQKDQVSIFVRDVETKRRAYETISQRSTQVNLEAQNNKSALRILSVAVEPFEPSLKSTAKGIVMSLAGGLLLAMGVAMLLELVNRRVRGTEDLAILHGVPVIGVLRPADSKRPIFRQLATANSPTGRAPLLTNAGVRS
jgi:chain length determinant protein EpsF